jgi:hypothetical protein
MLSLAEQVEMLENPLGYFRNHCHTKSDFIRLKQKNPSLVRILQERGLWEGLCDDFRVPLLDDSADNPSGDYSKQESPFVREAIEKQRIHNEYVKNYNGWSELRLISEAPEFYKKMSELGLR